MLPEPEVAVADDLGQRLRPVLAQPPEPVFDRGMRLADRVELVDEPLEHVAGLEEREPLRRDGVDLRELFRELEVEPGRRPPHDPSTDRLALDQLHREGLVAAELAEVGHRMRHLHTGVLRGLDHLKLLLELQRCRMDHADRGAPDEHRPLVGLHRPRLLRRAAGEEVHRADTATERLLQLARPGGGVAQADWPPSTTSV
jgi:hypothetical protein